MKRKLGLLFATTVLTLTTTTSAMAFEVVIEGEEKTGKQYPTITEYYMDFEYQPYGDGELFWEKLGSREVHLIPKGEKFCIDDVDNVKFCVEDTVLSEEEPLIREVGDYGNPAWNGGGGGGIISIEPYFFILGNSNEYLDVYNLIFSGERLTHEYYSYLRNNKDNIVWAVSSNSPKSEEDGNYADGYWYDDIDFDNPDVYYFRFVDAPLLKQDTSTPKEEEEKVTPSEATPSEPEKSKENNKTSKGSSSGGGSSSSTKKVNTDTYPNATWQKLDDGTWMLKKSNGEYVKGWAKVKGIWYHMNLENGLMTTGWITDIDGKIYYLTDTGAMVQGWNFLDNKWYYFETTGARFSGWLNDKSGKWYYLGIDGVMLFNTTTPDGYQVDSNGAWIP